MGGNQLGGPRSVASPKRHDGPSHDPSTMCGYKGVPCFEPRATKLNGSPHKLCEGHRRAHNATQSRYIERRNLHAAVQQLGGATMTRAEWQELVDSLPEPVPFETTPSGVAYVELASETDDSAQVVGFAMVDLDDDDELFDVVFNTVEGLGEAGF